MAKASRSRARSTKIEIPDLSGVESSSAVPADDYLLEVVDVEEGEGDKAAYLKWTFEVVEGKHKGSKPSPHITSFAENALFNLKGVLAALGVEIPEEAFDLDKDELIGLQCMGTVEHETYKGRKQAKIVDFFSTDEPESEKEAPARGKRSADKDTGKEPARRTARGKKEPDPIAQSDVEAMSQDELEDLVTEYGLDVDLAKQKTLRKMKAVVIDALTEAKLLDE